MDPFAHYALWFKKPSKSFCQKESMCVACMLYLTKFYSTENYHSYRTVHVKNARLDFRYDYVVNARVTIPIFQCNILHTCTGI